MVRRGYYKYYDILGGEIQYLYKLTPMHLNCERNMRQRVSLAVQLFGRRVAGRFRMLGFDDLADLILLIDSYWDCCDSRCRFGPVSILLYSLHL